MFFFWLSNNNSPLIETPLGIHCTKTGTSDPKEGPQEEQKVNPLFKGKKKPLEEADSLCLVFVGCFTWLKVEV